MSGTITHFPSLSEPQIAVDKTVNLDIHGNDHDISGPFKILLLGDASVGKTSIIRRLISGKFDDSTDYTATIGIDYKRKVIKIPNISSLLLPKTMKIG